MSITRDEAISYISHFYNQVMAPHGPYQDNPYLAASMIESVTVVIDEAIALGKSPREALEMEVHGGVALLGILSGKLNTTQNDLNKVYDGHPVAELVEPAPLIDLLYPNASAATKAQLLDAIENGHITNTGLTIGVLDQTRTNPAPSADAIIETVLENVGGTAPTVDFHYPGLTTAQTDFITTIYVGIFGRAPENEGLNWWSFEMKNFLHAGMNHDQALREVAKFMYYSGTVAGEGGTGMSNADFVAWTYQNSLGRAPDAGGHSYWTDLLDRGVETRDSFAVSFLGAALGAAGDSDYLKARVAVAKWAAQEHVSGEGVTWPDLVAVLRDVKGPADAFRKIGELQEIYGDAPAAKGLAFAKVAPLAGADVPDLGSVMLLVDEEIDGFTYGDADTQVFAYGDADTELVGLPQADGWM